MGGVGTERRHGDVNEKIMDVCAGGLERGGRSGEDGSTSPHVWSV